MKVANLASVAATLVAVAYVSHEVGMQGVEFAPPQTIAVPIPVMAPPSPNAEPEVGLDGPAPARVAVFAPAARPVPAVAVVETPKPVRSPAVYAMMARRQCANVDDGPDAFIQRIVAEETTISTARMDKIRALAEQCARITSETPMAELAQMGRALCQAEGRC
jgi:hypothetical protein